VPVSSSITPVPSPCKSVGNHKLGFDAGRILKENFKDDKILCKLDIDEKRLDLTVIIGRGE
jgi:hypothetical protein